MAAKLGFKIFAALLVMVPIITLFMVIGLEKNYVEQLKDEHTAMLARRSAVHKRSPLGQAQDQDNANYYREVSNPKKHIDGLSSNNNDLSHQAQVLYKSGSPVETVNIQNIISPGPEFYEMLKERKTYELRMEKSMQESWWYIRSQLEMLKSGKIPTNNIAPYLTDTLNSMKDQYNSARKWYGELKHSGSPDSTVQLNWQYWQKNVSMEMQSLMQKRLDRLQNPKDCDTARKLVCQVGKTCGFGCQMHHVSYCFILAFASERTLVLDSKGWSYSPKGWDSVFLPVSPCQAPGRRKGWSLTSTELTVSLPPVDNLSPRPPQLPMAVPSDLADRLMSFHGLPFAWFVSQFLSFLMRPSADLEQYIREKKERLALGSVDGPIVGIHVRRTDKKSEARYHDLREYMNHVNEWYEWYEMEHNDKEVKRRVFIATDEPSVLKEAKASYPDYEVHSDATITSLASKTSTRYSTDSLFGVIFDVTVLSECDFLVCTFSSQVCRLAYELMQQLHVDASRKYYSLDDVYYFGGQQAHNVQAIQDHDSSKQTTHDGELSFEAGDLFGIAGNEKNGYSVGKQVSSQKRGQFPSYKVEEQVRVADFPTYNDV